MDFQRIFLSDAQKYRAFIERAVDRSTYFSICTKKGYRKNRFSDKYWTFMKAIEPYEREQKKVTFPPHYVKGQRFHLYTLQKETKDIILSVPDLSAWGPPDYPEDLAFYSYNQLWFYAISHEDMAFVKSGVRRWDGTFVWPFPDE